MFENYKDVLTMQEVTDMLQVGKVPIIHMIKSGRLPCILISKRKYLFRKEDVIKLLDEEVAAYGNQTKKDPIN